VTLENGSGFAGLEMSGAVVVDQGVPGADRIMRIIRPAASILAYRKTAALSIPSILASTMTSVTLPVTLDLEWAADVLQNSDLGCDVAKGTPVDHSRPLEMV
jgi:hypothetical protein